VDAGSAFDEGVTSGRRSRVVLTPRRWRQVLRITLRGDGGKKADLRGERGISRKPLRAGMPGDSGATAVNTRVHFPHLCAHEAVGALGIRHSPRPFGAEVLQQLGRIARRDGEAMLEGDWRETVPTRKMG
jgi:hypothetical protein